MTEPAHAETPARQLIRGGRVLNVFTGELQPLDVVVEAGRIAALLPPGEASGASAAEVVDADGGVLVPGYVEPHAHLGQVAEPVATVEQWAARGTTTVVADTYPWLPVMGDEALAAMLDGFGRLPVAMRWFVAPHARSFWPDEERVFGLERLEPLLLRDDVVGLGEITRWPLVERGDADLAAKIRRARALGKRVEGHSAGASPARILRLAQRGFTSCHEAITAPQVLDRLRAGLYVMLRHSSLRPDLPALLDAVRGDLVHSNRLMLTADGPTPVWVDAHGYMDHLIRLAIAGGVPAAAAYRMATLNPAMYYRIEDDVGSIAPGRRADILILEDLGNPTPVVVLAGGQVVARGGALTAPFPRLDWDRLVERRPAMGRLPSAGLLAQLPGPGEAGGPVLELAHTVIVRRGTAQGRPLLAVLYDWEGRWLTHAWLTGLADALAGLATSYNPAHQLLLLGRSPADMALAARRVAELGGGLVVAEEGRIIWELPLERAGFFTERPWPAVVAELAVFEGLLRQRGYRHGDPLYSLFFLSFDALPDYRLTIRGVWDVKGHRVLVPPRPLD
ncbi:MAG TPA: adenine deaminase C-terminal domain-containing protein [Limnochordales bacterium]|nr:adenine deaminase C-terminal domain-containing protein [Limnochordales bacterium]